MFLFFLTDWVAHVDRNNIIKSKVKTLLYPIFFLSRFISHPKKNKNLKISFQIKGRKPEPTIARWRTKWQREKARLRGMREKEIKNEKENNYPNLMHKNKHNLRHTNPREKTTILIFVL